MSECKHINNTYHSMGRWTCNDCAEEMGIEEIRVAHVDQIADMKSRFNAVGFEIQSVKDGFAPDPLPHDLSVFIESIEVIIRRQ